jgi:hypothetical protein
MSLAFITEVRTASTAISITEMKFPFNDEHIIPQTIGGTRTWIIPVCEKSNSKLGHDVDSPFIDSIFVNNDRLLGNLQSYRSAPTLNLSGTAQIDGRETHVTYKVQGDKKSFWHAHSIWIGEQVQEICLPRNRKLH